MHRVMSLNQRQVALGPRSLVAEVYRRSVTPARCALSSSLRRFIHHTPLPPSLPGKEGSGPKDTGSAAAADAVLISGGLVDGSLMEKAQRLRRLLLTPSMENRVSELRRVMDSFQWSQYLDHQMSSSSVPLSWDGEGSTRKAFFGALAEDLARAAVEAQASPAGRTIRELCRLLLHNDAHGVPLAAVLSGAQARSIMKAFFVLKVRSEDVYTLLTKQAEGSKRIKDIAGIVFYLAEARYCGLAWRFIAGGGLTFPLTNNARYEGLKEKDPHRVEAAVFETVRLLRGIAMMFQGLEPRKDEKEIRKFFEFLDKSLAFIVQHRDYLRGSHDVTLLIALTQLENAFGVCLTQSTLNPASVAVKIEAVKNLAEEFYHRVVGRREEEEGGGTEGGNDAPLSIDEIESSSKNKKASLSHKSSSGSYLDTTILHLAKAVPVLSTKAGHQRVLLGCMAARVLSSKNTTRSGDETAKSKKNLLGIVGTAHIFNAMATVSSLDDEELGTSSTGSLPVLVDVATDALSDSILKYLYSQEGNLPPSARLHTQASPTRMRIVLAGITDHRVKKCEGLVQFFCSPLFADTLDPVIASFALLALATLEPPEAETAVLEHRRAFSLLLRYLEGKALARLVDVEQEASAKSSGPKKAEQQFSSSFAFGLRAEDSARVFKALVLLGRRPSSLLLNWMFDPSVFDVTRLHNKHLFDLYRSVANCYRQHSFLLPSYAMVTPPPTVKSLPQGTLYHHVLTLLQRTTLHFKDAVHPLLWSTIGETLCVLVNAAFISNSSSLEQQELQPRLGITGTGGRSGGAETSSSSRDGSRTGSHDEEDGGETSGEALAARSVLAILKRQQPSSSTASAAGSSSSRTGSHEYVVQDFLLRALPTLQRLCLQMAESLIMTEEKEMKTGRHHHHGEAPKGATTVMNPCAHFVCFLLQFEHAYCHPLSVVGGSTLVGGGAGEVGLTSSTPRGSATPPSTSASKKTPTSRYMFENDVARAARLANQTPLHSHFFDRCLQRIDQQQAALITARLPFAITFLQNPGPFAAAYLSHSLTLMGAHEPTAADNPQWR